VAYFLSFISCLFFFLQGYLYRPYLDNRNSLTTLLIVFTLLFFIKPKILPATTTLVSSLLVAAFVIGQVSGIEMYFFKATLTIITCSLITITTFKFIARTNLQAFVLWLQF
jgi:hypothetical protein